jgi:hypothetical protein
MMLVLNSNESSMKKLIIGLTVCGLALLSARAQEREGVKKEGANEAEYNSEGQERDNSPEPGKRDQSTEKGKDSQGAGSQIQDASSAANTAGTDTRVTSPSGSPGVLMDEGNPDGTNTMQSATLNIAGSPLPGATRKSSSPKADDRSPNRVFTNKKQKSVSAPEATENNQPKQSSTKK